jgi:hypothetical protein
MMVSLVQAAVLHITNHYGYKTYSPWGPDPVMGQVAIAAQAKSAGEDPDSVSWEIAVYGSGGFMQLWKVDNGDYDWGPGELDYWNIGAYRYGDTYYVNLYWYKIGISLYMSLNQYTIRLVKDGHYVDDRYRQYITEIPWP